MIGRRNTETICVVSPFSTTDLDVFTRAASRGSEEQGREEAQVCLFGSEPVPLHRSRPLERQAWMRWVVELALGFAGAEQVVEDEADLPATGSIGHGYELALRVEGPALRREVEPAVGRRRRIPGMRPGGAAIEDEMVRVHAESHGR